METGDVQNVDSSAPQQESNIRNKMKYVIQMVVEYFTVLLPVQRGHEETGRDIELGTIHTAILNEEVPEVDQLTAQDDQLERNRVPSDGRSVIQVTVSLVLSGGSFGVMYQVPGGLNEFGRAVLGDTIGFNLFLVADTLSFLASIVVATILATVSHRSRRLDCSICVTLWVAVLCFILTFFATAYLIVFPNHM